MLTIQGACPLQRFCVSSNFAYLASVGKPLRIGSLPESAQGHLRVSTDCALRRAGSLPRATLLGGAKNKGRTTLGTPADSNDSRRSPDARATAHEPRPTSHGPRAAANETHGHRRCTPPPPTIVNGSYNPSKPLACRVAADRRVAARRRVQSRVARGRSSRREHSMTFTNHDPTRRMLLRVAPHRRSACGSFH